MVCQRADDGWIPWGAKLILSHLRICFPRQCTRIKTWITAVTGFICWWYSAPEVKISLFEKLHLVEVDAGSEATSTLDKIESTSRTVKGAQAIGQDRGALAHILHPFRNLHAKGAAALARQAHVAQFPLGIGLYILLGDGSREKVCIMKM